MAGEGLKYQIFEALTSEEYEGLKASIAAHGVSQAVEVDEDGEILDGHHRFAICRELGMPCPLKVVGGLGGEQEKRDYVREVNLARRHLGLDARKQQAEAVLREHTNWSNRRIGQATGMHNETVKALRKEMEARDEIVTCETLEGKDGKGYPAEQGKAQEQEGEPVFPFRSGSGAAGTTTGWAGWHGEGQPRVRLAARQQEEAQAHEGE